MSERKRTSEYALALITVRRWVRAEPGFEFGLRYFGKRVWWWMRGDQIVEVSLFKIAELRRVPTAK